MMEKHLERDKALCKCTLQESLSLLTSQESLSLPGSSLECFTYWFTWLPSCFFDISLNMMPREFHPDLQSKRDAPWLILCIVWAAPETFLA